MNNLKARLLGLYDLFPFHEHPLWRAVKGGHLSLDELTDAERLDVFNGLLLAAHLDAAFDGGLISFNSEGGLIASPKFRKHDRELLGIHEGLQLRQISEPLVVRLAWHREHIFQQNPA